MTLRLSSSPLSSGGPTRIVQFRMPSDGPCRAPWRPTTRKKPPRGFEPRTDGLRNHCSTAELRRLAAPGYSTAPTPGAVLAGDAGVFLGAGLAQHELALLGIDQDGVTFVELAIEHGHGERVLEAALDDAFEWARPIHRVVAFGRDQVQGGRRQL